jgi:hypothetical protein
MGHEGCLAQIQPISVSDSVHISDHMTLALRDVLPWPRHDAMTPVPFSS